MTFGTNGQLWPNRTIPFQIDAADFPVGSAERTVIDQAITEWNDNSVIRLIPWSDEADFIVFEDTGTTCASGVGRTGGRQTVTCDLEGGGFSVGSITHEIGHVVGFLHEAKRPDRGSFIEVKEENIIVGKESQFSITTDGRILTDYDCGSIMHYPATAFSSNGSPTIEALSAQCAAQIGQRERLSGRDVWGASLLYGVPMRSVVVWEDDSNGDALFDVHASGFAERGPRCCGPLTANRLLKNQQRTPEVGIAGNEVSVQVVAGSSEGWG